MKILVIDDDVSVSTVVNLILKYKYDVATTNCPLSAFNYLSQHKVDLVLLDIKMPLLNGIEALREIKKRHPETVVIMLTAYASEDNIREAKALGAHGFIGKPFDIVVLRKYVDKVLSLNS